MQKIQPLRLAQAKQEVVLTYKNIKHLLLNDRIDDILQQYSNNAQTYILANLKAFKLKHSYHLYAIEKGFSNWFELKKYIVANDCLYAGNGVMFIHSWFTEYKKAKLYQTNNGGYLLCFWDDIVVCGIEYIACLKLEKYKYYWEQLGYDWVMPKSNVAKRVLEEKAVKNYLKLNQ